MFRRHLSILVFIFLDGTLLFRNCLAIRRYQWRVRPNTQDTEPQFFKKRNELDRFGIGIFAGYSLPPSPPSSHSSSSDSEGSLSPLHQQPSSPAGPVGHGHNTNVNNNTSGASNSGTSSTSTVTAKSFLGTLSARSSSCSPGNGVGQSKEATPRSSLSSTSAPVAKIVRPNFTSRQPIQTHLISSQVKL